jgi:hypothetical protein
LVVWRECTDLLNRLGYEWFDGLLLPCATREREHETVNVNAGSVVCALPKSAREELVQHDLSAQATSEELGIAALASKDWAVEVSADENRIGRIYVPFDDSLPVFGFYPAETNGSGSWWRWSGPTPRARFVLPLPAAGRWFLQLDVLNWGIARNAATLRLFVQNLPVSCIQQGAHFARFGPIEVRPCDAKGFLSVDIVTPVPQPTSQADPRHIGVNISGCVLERAA